MLAFSDVQIRSKVGFAPKASFADVNQGSGPYEEVRKREPLGFFAAAAGRQCPYSNCGLQTRGRSDFAKHYTSIAEERMACASATVSRTGILFRAGTRIFSNCTVTTSTEFPA